MKDWVRKAIDEWYYATMLLVLDMDFFRLQSMFLGDGVAVCLLARSC